MDMDMDMDMDTDNQHGPAAEPCLGPLVTVPAPLRTRMGAPHREERAHFTASMSSAHMSSAAAAGASSPAEPVGRKRVDTKEVAVLEEDINDTVSLRFWFRAGAVAVCVTTVPTVIGIATAHVEHAVAMPDVKMWYKCWGPNIVLMLAEIAAASLMAPRIGFDMIEERSNNISIKESMRSIITSQGLIAALFLTVIFTMIQSDPPVESSPYAEGDGELLNQWYGALTLTALLHTMMACTISVICLIYIEPLSDEASIRLISYGLMYFGEPIAYCGCAFVNTTMAIVVWMFGHYGLGVGLIGCGALLYCVMRVLVVYQYFSAWVNEEIEGEARKLRDAFARKHVTVGTVKKESLTQEGTGRCSKQTLRVKRPLSLKSAKRHPPPPAAPPPTPSDDTLELRHYDTAALRGLGAWQQ